MISFVLPAHDEEAQLPRALEAIHNAARALGKDYEIIVADDASTDRTADLAREGGARVVSIQARQIAAARNAGAAVARGDVLFFIDADTQVTTEAVSQALAALDRGAVGGGGPVRFDGPVPRYATVALAITLALFRLMRYTGGCFLFCARAAFERAKGWDQTLYAGEEIRMAQALKREGPFVIVRAPVITSGRKLRSHGPWELLAMFVRLALQGTRAGRSREGLDLWYGPRRPDALP
jgi:glycosyltransferase involved in cell wall biosynthesis